MEKTEIEVSPNFETEADLICEALVREIGRANRWIAIREAWLALLSVRRMAKQLNEEQESFSLQRAASKNKDI